MRIGAIISPVGDWSAIEHAAVAAEDLGYDAVGLWGHYHSARPEWKYVAGWAAYGALAAVTSRVKIVPMVVNILHYEPGVLAKESSLVALASGDRFELGIGAGDWPESYAAWGRPFPDRAERVARLEETVAVLRRIWTGEQVTFKGRFHSLREARVAPVPAVPPRVVVGVGGSRLLIESAARYADEINVYADHNVLDHARTAVARAGRSMDLSVFFSWEWEKWPADPAAELASWAESGADRLLVSLGGDDMAHRLHQLAPLLEG